MRHITSAREQHITQNISTNSNFSVQSKLSIFLMFLSCLTIYLVDKWVGRESQVQRIFCPGGEVGSS